MNGDFRLIDYINDLFLGKPIVCFMNTWKTERVAWDHFNDVLILFVKRLKFTIN